MIHIIEEIVISFKTDLSNDKGEVANLDVLRFRFNKERINNINEDTVVQNLDEMSLEYSQHSVLD